MKIAIVHELLTIKGGAERVAKIFADMFPDAPVYTLLYDEKKLGDWFPAKRVRTSNIQKLAIRSPIPATRFNHHLYLSRFSAAVEAWDFTEFDFVLSSSSAFAHGIITNSHPKHLCYVESPARYLWDRTHDVARNVHPLLRPFFKRAAHKLRIWDSEAADRPDKLIAASREIQRRIEIYWRRKSIVIHPPIDDYWLATHNSQPVTRNYFLIVSTLSRYKRIDMAIDAANALGVHVKIAGEGHDAKRLMRRAGKKIEFLGYQPIEKLRELYTNAIVTVFPGEEDFGLVPLESMACGTPVIAYKKGGALETVTGKTGVFFDQPSAESLMQTMNNFGAGKFDPADLYEHAAQFSRQRFENAIKEEITALVADSFGRFDG